MKKRGVLLLAFALLVLLSAFFAFSLTSGEGISCSSCKSGFFDVCSKDECASISSQCKFVESFVSILNRCDPCQGETCFIDAGNANVVSSSGLEGLSMDVATNKDSYNIREEVRLSGLPIR